jgi:hypothetical protein
MSENFQSGQHPDADQLSAFVEQALPAHDREATLAHLAICAECRAVVALALPAGQMAKPAQKPARQTWFHGWKVGWSAAAAVAAVALAIAYVHHVKIAGIRAVKQAEIAIAPPPPPIPPPALAQKQASAPAPRLAAPSPANQPRNEETLNALQQAPQVQHETGGGGGGGRNSLINQDLEKKSSTMAGDRGQNTQSLAAKEQPRALVPPATPVKQLAGGAAGASEMQGAFATAGPTASANEASVTAALKATAPVHPLPSGLPVLATAEHGRQMLALDTAHALFLSEDAGSHWRAVAVPWKAHAVAISLVLSSTRAAAKSVNGLDTGAGTGIGAGSGAGSGFGPAADVVRQRAAAGGESITGTVTDQSGATIAGTSVVVSRAADHFTRSVRTDANGRYTVAGLAPGTYDVDARASGFQSAHVSAVSVSPAGPSVTNFKLAVGTASETVTVATSRADEIPLQRPAQAVPPANAPAPVATTPVFEITTEDGARWSSADGVTWKRE